MLLQEKPAKKKVKLLAHLQVSARSTKKSGTATILYDDFDSDEEPNGIVDPAGLDDNTDSDESGPGEQESREEEQGEQEEGSDQETAVAEEPSPSGLVMDSW